MLLVLLSVPSSEKEKEKLVGRKVEPNRPGPGRQNGEKKRIDERERERERMPH